MAVLLARDQAQRVPAEGPNGGRWWSPGLPFVGVVDIHAPRRKHAQRLGVGPYDAPHQVPEVAALLYQRAPRVAAEPVPVSHLGRASATVVKEKI